jgi:hypothetical protein
LFGSGVFLKNKNFQKCRDLSADSAGKFILPKNVSSSSGSIYGINVDPSGIL